MSSNQVIAFLEKYEIGHKISGENAQLNCPFCGDTRGRLGIHLTTAKWRCFNCNARSNNPDANHNIQAFNRSYQKFVKGEMQAYEATRKKVNKTVTVKKGLAEKYHEKACTDKRRKALPYMFKQRGISKRALRYFKIGSKTKFKNQRGEFYEAGEHVSIPYFENGKCVNLKYRLIDPSFYADPEDAKKYKWRRETGGKTAIFNDDVLDDHAYDTVIIVESEIDAMSVWSNGFENVVGMTAGAQGFQQEWIARFSRFSKIYLLLDNDSAGQDGARTISEMLGSHRCFNVTLPDGVKDPNEFFYDNDEQKQARTGTDFQKCLEMAQRFEIKSVMSGRELFKSIIRKEESTDTPSLKIPSAYKKVSKLTDDFGGGDFVVVCARSKTGKTSYIYNEVLNWANNGIKGMVFQCESTPQRTVKTFVRMTEPSYLFWDTITPLQMRRTMHREAVDNIFFTFPTMGDFDLESVVKKVTEVVKREGCKYVVFDNLLFLARQMKGDMKDIVGEISQRFKLLAVELDIVFILITHPRKVSHNRALSPEDLKESSSLFQDLDHLILLHRAMLNQGKGAILDDDDDDDTSVMSNLMEVNVISRWSEGGRCTLMFDGYRGRIYESGIEAEEIKKAHIEMHGDGVKKKKAKGV